MFTVHAVDTTPPDEFTVPYETKPPPFGHLLRAHFIVPVDVEWYASDDHFVIHYEIAESRAELSALAGPNLRAWYGDGAGALHFSTAGHLIAPRRFLSRCLLMNFIIHLLF